MLIMLLKLLKLRQNWPVKLHIFIVPFCISRHTLLKLVLLKLDRQERPVTLQQELKFIQFRHLIIRTKLQLGLLLVMCPAQVVVKLKHPSEDQSKFNPYQWLNLSLKFVQNVKLENLTWLNYSQGQLLLFEQYLKQNLYQYLMQGFRSMGEELRRLELEVKLDHLI